MTTLKPLTPIQKAQAVHARLATIEELYDAFLHSEHCGPYKQFAEETYNQAKTVCEQEAERLDRVLQGMESDLVSDSEPTLLHFNLLTILASLHTLIPITNNTLSSAVQNNNVTLTYFLIHANTGVVSEAVGLAAKRVNL